MGNPPPSKSDDLASNLAAHLVPIRGWYYQEASGGFRLYLVEDGSMYLECGHGEASDWLQESDKCPPTTAYFEKGKKLKVVYENADKRQTEELAAHYLAGAIANAWLAHASGLVVRNPGTWTHLWGTYLCDSTNYMSPGCPQAPRIPKSVPKVSED